jgi:hypothetical protein
MTKPSQIPDDLEELRYLGLLCSAMLDVDAIQKYGFLRNFPVNLGLNYEATQEILQACRERGIADWTDLEIEEKAVSLVAQIRESSEFLE